MPPDHLPLRISASQLASLRIVDPRVVVIEADWGGRDDPDPAAREHIPGAVFLDTDDLETGYPEWRLRLLPELAATLGAHSISGNETVVVYGAQVIAAARAWWVMHYAGVRDVRILDGGLVAWRDAGLAVASEFVQPLPATFAATPRLSAIATTADVREALEQATIADVRSRAEFDGEISGYGYLDARGRIPGATHAGDADDAAALYSRAGYLRDPREIAALWAANGIRPGDVLIFSCGSGWRSSLAYFYACELGFASVRNYSDGWIGWSTRYVRDETVTTGSTPGWRQERTANPGVTG